jgi:hypothetical protein
MKSTAAALQREADDLLRRAEQADEDEDRRYGKDKRGDELPEELAHRESRLKKIREAMAALKAEAKEQARAEGKDPRRAEPENQAQRSFTDPESRIQKQGRNYIQGYNAQGAVDERAQVIVSQHVTSMQPDVNELLPVVKRISKLLKVKPKQFQIFDAYVLKGWPVKKIIQTLGVTRTQIYLAKFRISKLLKKEIKQLEIKDVRLVKKPVTTGLHNWKYTEITSGLVQGEPVVVSLDRPEVTPGTRVVVTGEAEQ